ncbi:MAG: histidine kinase dimerization/phospho-acceptor domain-containing protein [Sphingomicrobium sp.]
MDQPSGDAHDRAIRWRQLVDLLARAGSVGPSPYARAALEIVREDRDQVNESLRAAAARAVAAFPLPFELIALFASDSLKISAPILAVANLDDEQWSRVSEAADDETRAFILALHPQAGRAQEPARHRPRTGQSEGDATASTAPSISDVIARIERLREARQESVAEPAVKAAQPAETDGASLMFRWECNSAGEFAWVEGAPRGALIGRALADPAHVRDNGNDQIARAFSLRAPFRNAVVALGAETVLGGEWQMSGIPAFEPANGRFAGYRGIARRIMASAAEIDAPQPDSLRELVHEIKTPLNAIMGFAEIIEGEMFGPADATYRMRAGEIVAQANLLLAAIDDLDFAAKSQSLSSANRSFADLGKVIEQVTPPLRERAADRGVILDSSRTTRDLTAAIEPMLAERLILRMCNAVIERCERGEQLRLLVDQSEKHCRVSITRPTSLRGISDDELFGGPGVTLAQGLSLRLTRGLAQVAGADLLTSAETFTLTFARALLGGTDAHGYGSRTG